MASPELNIILRSMQAVACYIFEVYIFGFRELTFLNFSLVATRPKYENKIVLICAQRC